MQKAIQAVKENGLRDSPCCRKMGPLSELFENEENVLVSWILAMAKRGFPVHKTNLIMSVKKYLEDNGREPRYLNKSKTPGRSWFEGFLKRHPEIKQKHAESLSKARAAVTQDRIHRWFDEILDYFKENNLQDILRDPTRIFNGDESGFMLCPKSGNVLGPTKSKGDFYQRVSAEKEQITVMATFSADGKITKIEPKDMLMYCRYIDESNSRGCESLFRPVFVDGGLCYSFNNLGRDDIFNDHVYNYANYYEVPHKVADYFDVETGYKKNVGIDTYPRRTLKPGPENGITILLKFDERWYDPTCNVYFKGFRVSIIRLKFQEI
ncbi:hypothetical protein Zmor_001210 [Zophobas morio]|uniref:HTH CENPB-type domain-containing protein n=1 Tax=Zophobas morio TaxID=2755281 RepID=A0AA38IYN0_9CUCU|nr:hypothetical protein Zmor_001210 [Zophobas morio]